MIRAKPCAPFIVASVAINGGNLRMVMSRPFIAPRIAPTVSPSKIPSQTLRPIAITVLPTIIPTSAIIVPTDRSIPPVMMTKVLPIAKRPITVVDIKIPPETFSQDAKTGRLIVKNAKMTTRLASAVTLPISRLTKAFNFPTS